MKSPIILHIDFNSYFASVEQQANPFLRGKPLGITGKGRGSLALAAAHRREQRVHISHLDLARSVITTASREAKAFGVRTAMASWEARRISPTISLIPGDPQKYAYVTHTFLAILRQYCDAVEPFSADEAFADCTHSAGDFFGATILAQRLRAVIREQIGEACTVSIGIGPNKVIAKLASESVKPNGLTVVLPEDVSDFVLRFPLTDICGIGPNVARRLAELGVTSVATLRELPLGVLRATFQSYGDFLYHAARGEGDVRIVTGHFPPKSVGHSYTLPFDIFSADDGYRHLLFLAERVAWRLRKHRKAATQVVLFARFSQGRSVSTRVTVNDALADGARLIAPAWERFTEQVPWEGGVRVLGLSASGLLALHGSQSLLVHERRWSQVLTAADQLHARYGFGVLRPAATLGTTLQERVSGWHYDHED